MDLSLSGVAPTDAGNLSAQRLNLTGHFAVWTSDEHRMAGRDARRCDGWGPMV